MKDLPLANRLLAIIGSGHIRHKIKDNACVFIISSVKGLRLIVNLLNGYLRTPKVHQLYLLIEWLNKHHGSYFKNLPLDESPIDSNS